MNVRRVYKNFALAAVFVLLCGPAFAVLFTAEDKAFTIDLPSSWVKINTQSPEVLSLKRDAATMKISLVPNCHDVACIEGEIQKALDFVKSRKFRILENTYSGEIIKRTEFSTGDPLLSFNYSGAAVDFTTAFFLASGNAYYVGIKGIPYVEADLILSFISPKPGPTDKSAAVSAPRMYDEPEMLDIALDADDKEGGYDILPSDDAMPAPQVKTPALTPPPVVRPKPKMFKIGLSAVFVYFILMIAAFGLRLVLPAKPVPDAANPRSSYPVKGLRLYGSPDLFFKIHDNQGNNYIVNSSRWGGIFTGLGLAGALFFFLLKTGADYAFGQGLVTAHAAVVNTIVSLSSLFSVLGLVAFAAGLTLSMLLGVKIFIYNDKGDIAFKIVKKGFGFLEEEYIIADGKSAVLCRAVRARFMPLRNWVIYDAHGQIARIKENTPGKAAARMLLGHMCGFLRADYDINGRVESKGTILSYGRIFTYFRSEIDKPEAIPPETILAATALIYTRDRDKWHPWVN